MAKELKPTRLDIYRTAIPMRGFEHAAAGRDLAEAIVTCMHFSDGGVAWGETLPRDYVTGETLDSVLHDLRDTLWPAVAGAAFSQLSELSGIPLTDTGGRCICAARCATELPVAMQMLNESGDRSLAKAGPFRVSGVLGSRDPGRTARRLRLMRLYGLRDFKLKLGLGEDVDAENLRVVDRRIGRAVRKGNCTLRVDVNGGWQADETPQRVAAMKAHGVCVVEQPVFCPAAELAQLAGRCELPLMADESLCTPADAKALLPAGRRVWWNIRIAKNGGFTAAANLARQAAKCGIPFVVGCMVGETSILSAAQRWLLATVPSAEFVEGNYGRLLLSYDVTARSLRFGYGGRLAGPGRSSGRPHVKERLVLRHGRLLGSLSC